LSCRADGMGRSTPEQIAALLDAAPIVAATAATLASAGYDGQSFDVAIVDEAAQLTVPAALAALRLAGRFVLVGADRQLPGATPGNCRRWCRATRAKPVRMVSPQRSSSCCGAAWPMGRRGWSCWRSSIA